MGDRYRLGGLDDAQLLSAVSELVRRENDSLSDLLAHLAELDERGICVERGYSSLFAYCREALGFSKSSAGRRIAAARICRKYPEAFARVANGELELSVLCALGQYLTAGNAAELFAVCSRKSYEQVEVLLAARFPKPEARELIRRLPVASGPVASGLVTPHVETSAPAIPLACHEPERAAPVAAQPSREASVPSERSGTVRPRSSERFSVNFTADPEFVELLEEVRALLSHAEPKGDLMSVMKRGLTALREVLLKKRFGVGRKPRRVRARGSDSRPTSEQRAESDPGGFKTREGVKRPRHVSAEVTREVYARDGGQCTFCAADGRRCGERRFLQLDHVILHSEGGEATVENLRLRCRSHNLHTARMHFGNGYIHAAVAHARAAAQGVEEQATASIP